MIKVFLVEDEVVMRNGIKKNIPWEEEGFSFVGEASDGELAYPLIKKEKPDILITDIKMPFMDGLELSRLVKKEMPQIKIIILSGYNEFDYAKTAISIGVTEYLLKPISSAKLLEAVKKVGKMIEQEQEQSSMLERYRMEMWENIEMQKHNLWISLASNQMSVAELLEAGQKVDIDFTASCYQVVLFKLMGNTQAVTEASREIGRLNERWKKVLVFDRSPEGWAILIKGESEEEIRRTSREMTLYLQELLNGYGSLEYFGGAGIIVQRLRDVSSSYRNAAKAFASRFFVEKNQIVGSKGLQSLQGTRADKIDVSVLQSRKVLHDRLEQFMKSGTLDDVDSFTEQYFEAVGEQNYRSMMYRQYVIMDLYFTVTDFLNTLELSVEDLSERYCDINRVIPEAARDDQLFGLVSGLFMEVLELRDKKARKKYNDLLEEAKLFIQQNYPSENMSLNTVAARINMSPSYFSAVFSAETGQTFVEYLTAVRLNKAKELLMCTAMRTAEIAYEVGYKDSHYFSYIFRKVVGCSPKEFKNRGREQEG